MVDRLTAFGPSRTQRIGTISVVVLLHLVVFVYRGGGLSPQPPHVAHVTPRSSISVTLAPVVRPATSTESETHRKQARSAAAPPAPTQASPSAVTSGNPAATSTNDAEAEHAQSQQTTAAAQASTTPPGADSDADYSRNPPPAYPPASRRFREEGRVLLSVLVAVDGAVKEVSVEKSSGYPRLDEAALNAVRHWVFVPATRGGVPVAAHIRVPVNFVLSS